MTIHIGAKPGDIAETVLMPGDPYRAKWAAETFLKDAKLVNEVRGMLGFTGTWNGNRVTIQGSGMGMPSLSIYANELISEYNAQTLIRIGSCGGMQPQVGIRDVIIAMTATTITSPSSGIFRERITPPAPIGPCCVLPWTRQRRKARKPMSAESIPRMSFMPNAPIWTSR